MIRKSRIILFILISLALLLTIGNMVYPSATKIVLNILWFTALSVALIFITMGIMSILGMKKEVGQLLEAFMEGSFSVMDLIDFIKGIFRLFVIKVKEALLSIAPLFSYIMAISSYIATLYLYKLVGKTYDVTVLTIIISVLGVALLSYLTLPGKNTLIKTGWWFEFTKKVNKSFVNSFEVVLFLFFLTMDSTHLFFVPPDLNIPLKAKIFDYDLMLRGFNFEDMKTTLIIIAAAIFIEIFRNALKIAYSSHRYYLSWVHEDPNNNITDRQKHKTVKRAIRTCFTESKDELVRFISFTTVLIIVFVTFPRLKLMSMLIASITLLIFDLTFTPRLLTKQKGQDIISVILEKVLRI